MTDELLHVVMLLVAAIVAVPVFRRFGLGSVLGYLSAGVIIGPAVLGLFTSPQSIVHVAELGVVMFLFVIGLEMRPSHLWSMRKDIFGLGLMQTASCGAVLTFFGVLLGLSLSASIVAAWGFVLTSTAVVAQTMAETGEISRPSGQKVIAILLFEDMLIVPLLAAVSLLSPIESHGGGSRVVDIGLALGSLALLISSGIWLLDPLFRLLSYAKARELMTAAALLVVLGAALLMDKSGLSMAMGAFLAGVLLSESSFRHQLEADIEPFKGILMGMFFIGVGMSLDVSVIIDHWEYVLVTVFMMSLLKAITVFCVARVNGSERTDAVSRAIMMSQGGEFAFVLFAHAVAEKVIDPTVSATMTAVVVISMALASVSIAMMKAIKPKQFMEEGEEIEKCAEGGALIIGFGRFGQAIGQALMIGDVEMTVIDSDAAKVHIAQRAGHKIYFGDGGRLDILRASGAETMRVIIVCVDDPTAAERIVSLILSEFPNVRVLARARDRGNALQFARMGVHYYVRETFDSALRLAQHTLYELGFSEDDAGVVVDELRYRDDARFKHQLAETVGSEYDTLHMSGHD